MWCAKTNKYGEGLRGVNVFLKQQLQCLKKQVRNLKVSTSGGTAQQLLDQAQRQSHLISFTLPESMTKPTSSMVMDVSATLVATTILRAPVGMRSKTRT